MAQMDSIVLNVTDKLDQLSIEFSMDSDDVIKCVNDALRDMRISDISSVHENSDVELYVEIRAQWYALGRIRNSTSLNFKYNTGNDGKAVDKSMIPEMVNKAMNQLDRQYQSWISTFYVGSTGTGKTWNSTRRTGDTLA
jgi:DNA replication protein DnaC